MEDTTKANFETYLNLRNADIENAIHDMWISKDESKWRQDPYFYIRLGETAYKLGQMMFAYDVLNEGLQYFSEDVRLTQLFSLTLIKCGFLMKAQKLLSQLVKRGHRDEETLGILGRVYKDMWLLSGDDPTYIKRSRNLYLHAFKKSKGYYSGINAASLSYIIGDKSAAKKLATLVLNLCFGLLKNKQSQDYWCLATIGEGYLLLGKYDEAKKYFSLANKHSEKNYSEIASTRRQIKLLRKYIDISEDIFDVFKIPRVIAFTGHMIDKPNRRPPRFPPERELEIKEELMYTLNSINAGIGYSSVACGSDILFLECMQEKGTETNITLPFALDDFFKTSIEFAGEDWSNRAKKVIKNCSQIFKATEGKYSGDDLLFDYANSIIMGKTLLRSTLLESDPLLVAVWDGKKNRGAGGTYDFIQVWRSKNLPLKIVNIHNVRKHVQKIKKECRDEGISQNLTKSSDTTSKNIRIGRTIKTFLFADLVGYSTLKEEQLPFYVQNYLGKIAEKLRQSKYKPVFKNIWGDALYFVFDDLIHGAKYALELRDFIDCTDWDGLGLPNDLKIRIGLHAGPVYYAKEPILKKINYFGTHVNQAARIEPITNPGNVYASEQFASLLMASLNNELECKYVGIIVLPKKFGKYPIYHIKRKDEIV